MKKSFPDQYKLNVLMNTVPPINFVNYSGAAPPPTPPLFVNYKPRLLAQHSAPVPRINHSEETCLDSVSS